MTRELIRATIAHTPDNPFLVEGALRLFDDGGLLLNGDHIEAIGDFSQLREACPDARVTDWQGCLVLPGLVDAHVHFPQVRILGHVGQPLLEWLDRVALPEEARMADVVYARRTARTFLRMLAAHGTTAALVFGAHYAPATAGLFEEADAIGMRITTGLVFSDHLVPEGLRQTPDSAYQEASALIQRFSRRGRLQYAVTPRFALSTSPAMLDVCQTLVHEYPDVRVQSHLNENREEVAAVARAFPGASHYLDVYEHYGLTGRRAVLAHNVWPTDAELSRLASTGTTIAHCPGSNAALGSGIFPMRRHVKAGVPVALGTDVGAGVGFNLLREAFHAGLLQNVAAEPLRLTAAHLLYLATLAGATAVGLEAQVGDFSPGKAADLVCVRPPAGSLLETVYRGADDGEHALSAVFALADQQAIAEVRVAGVPVYRTTT